MLQISALAKEGALVELEVVAERINDDIRNKQMFLPSFRFRASRFRPSSSIVQAVS